MTPASDSPRRLRRPSWAGRNYTLLTAAAVVTNLGSQGALIAAAFAVLDAGGDGGDIGLVAAARTLPLVLFLLIGGAVADRLPRHRVMVAATPSTACRRRCSRPWSSPARRSCGR